MRIPKTGILSPERKKRLSLPATDALPSRKLKRIPVKKKSSVAVSGKTPEGTQVPKPVDIADHNDLPVSYNTTHLTLIARDPHWIHAYWEISPIAVLELQKKHSVDFSRSAKVLRLYDVTFIDFNGHNAHHWFDIDVGPAAENWYVNLWQDNVSYCAEIGFRTGDGRFFPLARSNSVTTPRVSSSLRNDMIWMEVKENAQADTYANAVTFEKNRSRSPQFPWNRSPKRKIYLTEDDIRAYYSKKFPLLRRLLNKRKGLKGRRGARGEYLSFEEALRKGFIKTSWSRGFLLGASGQMQEGASETFSSEREYKQRKFFFEIGTELIVYGRTEPDARVWMGEKEIKLRNDGTFTLRFALPEGNIPLDFLAQSADKVESRTISTSVERTKTSYGH